MKPLGRLTTFALTFGLWLLFAAKLNTIEVVAGLVSAAAAVVAMSRVAATGEVSFQSSLKCLFEGWRLPWYALSETVKILPCVAKQLFSREGAPSFSGAVRFDAGRDNPRDAARRALAVTYTSLTPNCIVLGVLLPQENHPNSEPAAFLLYHQMIPGPLAQMTQNMGARP